MMEEKIGSKDASTCRNLIKYHYLLSFTIMTPYLDTKASEKLSELLTNTTLCNDIMRLSPLYQTSTLEPFRSVIIHK